MEDSAIIDEKTFALREFNADCLCLLFVSEVFRKLLQQPGLHLIIRVQEQPRLIGLRPKTMHA